jgi:hypothetical protein
LTTGTTVAAQARHDDDENKDGEQGNRHNGWDDGISSKLLIEKIYAGKKAPKRRKLLGEKRFKEKVPRRGELPKEAPALLSL